jgi:hypothetical protein
MGERKKSRKDEMHHSTSPIISAEYATTHHKWEEDNSHHLQLSKAMKT